MRQSSSIIYQNKIAHKIKILYKGTYVRLIE